ncbi:hypothetical protein EYF80_041172 [Liparis tanakae]|uniref:Uncharacterized protein n=1 Tax=Liparis tanakae TaxID=230148 RepID=A0A4Z2G754_9TELE|nr:hypothetical protein EYF80_041172 [Liparis tanakae]
MASDYGDDSEPDSGSESEETAAHVSGLVYSYGDDELNRTENTEIIVSGDEESRESHSELEDSDELRDADDVEILELERKDPNELVVYLRKKLFFGRESGSRVHSAAPAHGPSPLPLLRR